MKQNRKTEFSYDFAISYAGEEEYIAEGIYEAIKEKYEDYNIFFAKRDRNKLIGNDGEEFFENLFNTSKQVIVVLSENYKKKEWTRYEWDIIKERNKENRCIPIKIDNVKILGLPSNFIYFPFNEDYEDIANLSIEKLVEFEKDKGILRKTSLEKLTATLKNSKGTLDKSVQLVYDNRKRSLLKNINFPTSNFKKSYEVIEFEESPYSKILRIILRINLPDNLTKEEVKFNIKHCTAEVFNKYKPDAIKLFIYSSTASNFIDYTKFNVARAEFAPFGNWGKAEEGFAYNIPSEKFDWKIEYEESYFDKNKRMKSSEELTEELLRELVQNRNKK